MGSTMEFLGELVDMPKGTGEQNMVDLAPAVFMQQYLKYAKHNHDEEFQKKIENLETMALQNQNK